MILTISLPSSGRGRSASPGGLRAGRAARELSLGQLAVLAELAADDLVIRTRSTQDRRQVLIEITDAGRDALRRDMAGATPGCPPRWPGSTRASRRSRASPDT
ncbi:MAG TPA: hypothetical protein VGG16_08160 [Streptosporangiaceae bacterium]